MATYRDVMERVPLHDKAPGFVQHPNPQLVMPPKRWASYGTLTVEGHGLENVILSHSHASNGALAWEGLMAFNVNQDDAILIGSVQS